MKSLADFIATREVCTDIAARIDAGLDGAIVGFVYDGDCYIEQCADGSFCLTLYCEEYRSATLAELEPILYAWCVTECPDSLDIPHDVHAFVCALQSAMPNHERDFARAMLANAAESNSNICHMHDYCDPNQCALDCVNDDLDAAINLYNKARPILRGRNHA